MLAKTVTSFPSNSAVNETELRKGQIWYAKLSGMGSVQNATRPVLVFQNDMASRHSPCVLILPISSKTNKRSLPTHVFLDKNVGLSVDSVVLCEQITTIDKTQLINFTGITLDKAKMMEVLKGIMIQLGVSIKG